ncbi:hypothetical protein ACFPRL_28690 [Pseudoclavibacter helvolus]
MIFGPPGATFWRRSPSDSPSGAGICTRRPEGSSSNVTPMGPQLDCADMTGSKRRSAHRMVAEGY